MGTWLLLLIASWVVPLLFGLIQSALSRSREYAADTLAVRLTGRPRALASALARLHQAQTPWLQRMLGPRATDVGWLDSHPATADRIARLEAMAPSRRPPGGWMRLA
jgi:heat shock protein HtpX